MRSVFDRSRSIILSSLIFKGNNWCGDDNGMCSHICFPLPADESRKTGCMCPDFFIMEANNKTCKEIGMYNVITLLQHQLYKPNLKLTGTLYNHNLQFNPNTSCLRREILKFTCLFHIPVY